MNKSLLPFAIAIILAAGTSFHVIYASSNNGNTLQENVRNSDLISYIGKSMSEAKESISDIEIVSNQDRYIVYGNSEVQFEGRTFSSDAPEETAISAVSLYAKSAFSVLTLKIGMTISEAEASLDVIGFEPYERSSAGKRTYKNAGGNCIEIVIDGDELVKIRFSISIDISKEMPLNEDGESGGHKSRDNSDAGIPKSENETSDTEEPEEQENQDAQSFEPIPEPDDEESSDSTIDPMSLYEEILALYVEAFENGWSEENYIENGLCYSYAEPGEDGKSKLGYRYMDMNGDGIPELVILPVGYEDSPEGIPAEYFEIYTAVDGSCKKVLEPEIANGVKYYFCDNETEDAEHSYSLIYAAPEIDGVPQDQGGWAYIEFSEESEPEYYEFYLHSMKVFEDGTLTVDGYIMIDGEDCYVDLYGSQPVPSSLNDYIEERNSTQGEAGDSNTGQSGGDSTDSGIEETDSANENGESDTDSTTGATDGQENTDGQEAASNESTNSSRDRYEYWTVQIPPEDDEVTDAQDELVYDDDETPYEPEAADNNPVDE